MELKLLEKTGRVAPLDPMTVLLSFGLAGRTSGFTAGTTTAPVPVFISSLFPVVTMAGAGVVGLGALRSRKT